MKRVSGLIDDLEGDVLIGLPKRSKCTERSPHPLCLRDEVPTPHFSEPLCDPLATSAPSRFKLFSPQSRVSLLAPHMGQPGRAAPPI